MPFPSDFIWGAGSAAYQTEGAWNEDGKGESIWDEFCRRKGAIRNGDTGETACDAYRRYPEDIRLMKDMGLKAYRFSLSWPRILPEGRGKANEKGLAFYDALVDMLLENGIAPYVTLYHWDLPYALHTEGGWLSRKTAEAFSEFAYLVAKRFDGRVRDYITMNEPQCFIAQGYARGVHAPGLTLPDDQVALCMHNALLAHGLAVDSLRSGSAAPLNIGIVSTGRVCCPAGDTPRAREAAKAAAFSFAQEDWYYTHHWVLDPAILGGYPENSPAVVGRLGRCVPARDFDIIRAKTDYIGLNVYHGCYVDDGGGYVPPYPGYPRTAFKWPITPEAIRFGSVWLYERYGLPVVVTENGLSCNDKIYLDGKVHDPDRIDFLQRYLNELKKACEEGVPVRGYFHWSLTDNFEWSSGYDERFGLVYVDYPTQRRIPKDSSFWYAEVVKSNGANIGA